MFTPSSSADLTVVAVVEQPTSKVSSRLPKTARSKLEHLHAVRDDARVMLDAAQAKVDALRGPDTALAAAQRELAELEQSDWRGRMYRRDREDKSEGVAIERDAERLAAAQQRVVRLGKELEQANTLKKLRGEQWQAAQRLTSQIEEWLKKGTLPLKSVAIGPPKLAEGKTALAELEAIRTLILAVGTERRRVERAFMPAADAKRRAREWVKLQAARVHVSGLVVHGGSIAVGGPDTDLTTGLLCWLEPDRIMRRLEQEIDQQVSDRFVLSELDQARELAALDAKMLDAERREEALIELLEAEGSTIARRANASPQAVLGVE